MLRPRVETSLKAFFGSIQQIRFDTGRDIIDWVRRECTVGRNIVVTATRRVGAAGAGADSSTALLWETLDSNPNRTAPDNQHHRGGTTWILLILHDDNLCSGNFGIFGQLLPSNHLITRVTEPPWETPGLLIDVIK